MPAHHRNSTAQSDELQMKMRRRQRPQFWLGVGGVSAATLGISLRIIHDQNSGQGLLVTALIPAILFVAAIFIFFGFRNSRRLKRAEQTFPSAIIVPVVVAPLLAERLTTLMTSLQLAPSRVKPTEYATLVADGEHIRLLTGPDGYPAASFPSECVRNVALGATLVGLRMMTAIDIQVATSEGTVSLPVTPMRNRGNWLRVVPDAEIALLADKLRRALGCPTGSRSEGMHSGDSPNL